LQRHYVTLLPTCCLVAILVFQASKNDNFSVTSKYDVQPASIVAPSQSNRDETASTTNSTQLRFSTENASEVVHNNLLFEVLEIQPKAWVPWGIHVPLPCYEGKIDTLEAKGFLFVKPKKCGSTTGSSLTVRIAHNLAKKRGYEMCQCWTDHKPAYNLGVGNRSREMSFMWSIVRNPIKRVTSEFYHFHVSREGVPSDDANFREFLKDRQPYENFFLRYLQSIQRRWNPIGDHVAVIRHILDSYDFIAVTERMDGKEYLC